VLGFVPQPNPTGLQSLPESFQCFAAKAGQGKGYPGIHHWGWPDCAFFVYPATKRVLERELKELADLSRIIIRPNVIYEPEHGSPRWIPRPLS
jgi:hypothetical protein